MNRVALKTAVAAVVMTSVVGTAPATTRDVAEMSLTRFTFDRSILNQLTYDTYRDPFDELQTRPHNLLFNNIGRHPNLSPWQGQEGSHTRYFNALIGNNGTANVDNDADAIQGALVWRHSDVLAWGVSASFLSGDDASNDTLGATSFQDGDNLSGVDVRGAVALQLSERRVLGAGLRLVSAADELMDSSFAPGVGGFLGMEEFRQSGFSLDVGMRQFHSPTASWETQLVVGVGTSEQDEYSEDIDDAGIVTDRFVVTNYDLSDISVGLYGGYNRVKTERIGETEFRVGVERTQMEFDNDDLSYGETAVLKTPTLTLLNQDPIGTTRVSLSAKSIFQAGETEMFAGAQVGHSIIDGATQVDASGVIVNEEIDDSLTELGLTVGVRQPLFDDKLRFIVSGRADLLDEERNTIFDTSTDSDGSTLSTAQYAIGLEGVLANVTFDVAWLLGEEAPVVPVSLGLPGGSRRSVTVDSLIFSAAVAW